MVLRWRLLLSLLAALVLSACAATTLPSGTVERYQRIGVASAIGDEARFVKWGLTVFENEEKTIAIPGWRLDQRAVDDLRSELGKRRPAITVVAYSGPQAPLFAAHQGMFKEFDANAAGGELRRWAEAERLDAILIVTKLHTQPAGFVDRSPNIAGVGFFGRSLFGGMRRYTSFVNARLIIVDPKDLKTIAAMPLWAARYPGGIDPAQTLYALDFMANASSDPPELVRGEIGQILDAEIANALPKLGF